MIMKLFMVLTMVVAVSAVCDTALISTELTVCATTAATCMAGAGADTSKMCPCAASLVGCYMSHLLTECASVTAALTGAKTSLSGLGCSDPELPAGCTEEEQRAMDKCTSSFPACATAAGGIPEVSLDELTTADVIKVCPCISTILSCMRSNKCATMTEVAKGLKIMTNLTTTAGCKVSDSSSPTSMKVSVVGLAAVALFFGL